MLEQKTNEDVYEKRHTKDLKTQDTNYQDSFSITLMHVDQMNIRSEKINNASHAASKIDEQRQQKKGQTIIDPKRLLCFRTIKKADNVQRYKTQQTNFGNSGNNFTVKTINNIKSLAFTTKKRFNTQIISFKKKAQTNDPNCLSNRKSKLIPNTTPIKFNRLISKTELKNIQKGHILNNQRSLTKDCSNFQHFLQQIYKGHTQSARKKSDEQMKKRMKYQSKKSRYRIKIPQLLTYKKGQIRQQKQNLSKKLLQSITEFKANSTRKHDIDLMRLLFKKRAASVQLNFLY